jgi:hypothetical protein
MGSAVHPMLSAAQTEPRICIRVLRPELSLDKSLQRLDMQGAMVQQHGGSFAKRFSLCSQPAPSRIAHLEL